MYNKLILVGNLTRDIELKYSGGGSAIANTAIATSRKFTSNGEKKEEVCFVDITFFGRSGEVANQYLRKGSKILVEGRLKFDQWTDQQGQKRSKHSVIVETMQMLDSKADSQALGNDNSNDYSQAPSASYADNQSGGAMTPSFGGTQSYQQQNAPQAAPQQQAPQQGGFGAPQGQQQGGYNQPPAAAPAQGGFGSQNGAQQQQQPAPQNAGSYQPQQLPEYDIDEDEIPF